MTAEEASLSALALAAFIQLCVWLAADGADTTPADLPQENSHA